MLKLSEVLAQWNPDERTAYEPIVLLEAAWEEIVGGQVARHSRPARIAGATLTITTRSSAWSHQLSFLSEHVIRAVAARLPGVSLERLQFRVGAITQRRGNAPPRRHAVEARPRDDRRESGSATEALARFRRDVEQRRRSRRSAGWKECLGCGALACGGSEELCAACVAARAQALAAATARLLFDAPWLGYSGTAALVDGLQREEYERVRSLMLAHWWGVLARARVEKRLSQDGRERLVASSYVLLRSQLSPEQIMPATVRSILGDELNDLLYGDGAV